MSKRSNRKRDSNAISSPRLRFSKKPQYQWVSPKKNLRVYEDRRSFHPQGKSAPARSFSSTRHRLKVAQTYIPGPTYTQSLFSTLPVAIGFQQPKDVLVCVRRKERREVMFALKKAGKSGQQTRKLSEYSGIRC